MSHVLQYIGCHTQRENRISGGPVFPHPSGVCAGVFPMGYMNIPIPDIAGTALGLFFSAGAAFGASIAILLNLVRPLISGQWTDDSPSGCPRVFCDWQAAPVSRETLNLPTRFYDNARAQELNLTHRKNAVPVAVAPEPCGKISTLCLPGGINGTPLTSACRRFCLSDPVQRSNIWILFSHPGEILKNMPSHQIHRQHRSG